MDDNLNAKKNKKREDAQAPSMMERTSDQHFKKALDDLIEDSEFMRLKRMQQNRSRNFIAINLGILMVLACMSGAGWFFIAEVKLTEASLCIMAPFLPCMLLSVWAKGPLRAYVRDHKTVFMPKMAKVLGGLQFYPQRGVSLNILKKLPVLPYFDRYAAEDCFMGAYKGVKVIFSEARLYTRKNGREPVFKGIFVLLEVPGEPFEGYTIITADDQMVKANKAARWAKMQEVTVQVSNPEWARFSVFTTKSDIAELLVGEKLLKELTEASVIFKDSPLSVVLFGKKYVFMMIPNDENMFEASNVFAPVTTKQHALQCKREIGQILEIIDVFDLYKPIT